MTVGSAHFNLYKHGALTNTINESILHLIIFALGFLAFPPAIVIGEALMVAFAHDYWYKKECSQWENNDCPDFEYWTTADKLNVIIPDVSRRVWQFSGAALFILSVTYHGFWGLASNTISNFIQ